MVSTDKWTKYLHLLKNQKLLPYLPETHLFSERTLWYLMGKYGVVIIKPSQGSKGNGVIKVSPLGDGKYEMNFGLTNTVVEGKKETFHFLKKDHDPEKLYIIQQWLCLAKIENCPFDIRVMVQRKRKSLKWVVTASLVKVAMNGTFITNYAKDTMTMEEGFKCSTLNSKSIDFNKLITEIENVALVTAKQLKRIYPYRRRIGLDIGVDENGKAWIIEVNLAPSLRAFERFEDNSMIQRIKKYQ